MTKVKLMSVQTVEILFHERTSLISLGEGIGFSICEKVFASGLQHDMVYNYNNTSEADCRIIEL